MAFFENMTTEMNPWRFCVAPMLDWTDRHCRYFHRQLSKHARLYTEMVTTGAIIYGDKARHLNFNEEEHPVALQLGGSDTADLAKCAKIAQDWGYDEINLNCGCPSERVQRGSFGACLMAEPKLVADCCKAMMDAVDIDVTVKHRIGIDKIEDYAFVRDFVGTLYEAGVRTFIVHTRNAWLKGLSPKENREVPPLKREVAFALKKDFPSATIVINGQVDTLELAEELLEKAKDTTIFGRVSPEQKCLLVTGLQKEGRTVGMIGDGVNDTPGLAAADVSVAMKDASDIAQEVADITLLSADLRELIHLRQLSTKLLDRINTNYRFILGFNTGLLVLGQLGILTPATSAVLHNISTMGISAGSMRPLLCETETHG